MKTRMTELFGIQHPIMCGGMMYLCTPEICAAISNAGAMGNLTAQHYPTKEEFRKAVHETRKLTGKPFNVNITAFQAVRSTKAQHLGYFQVCCEEQVAAIEVSGMPLDRYFGPEAIEQAKKAGVKLIHKVGSVKHAVHAEHAGYEAVIAAGIEEGGHPLNDDVTTMVLTPRIRESVKIPVIATGGIADGRGLAAALVLGADGVMMASRFVATHECTVHDKIKKEIVCKQEFETTLVSKTTGFQMRSWINSCSRKILEIEDRKGTFEEFYPYLSGKRMLKGEMEGDIDSFCLPVGQSIGLIKDIVSCKEVIDRMMNEARAIISNTHKLVEG